MNRLFDTDNLQIGFNLVEVLSQSTKLILDLYEAERRNLGLYFNRGDDYHTFMDFRTSPNIPKNFIYGTIRVDPARKEVYWDPNLGSGKWREKIQGRGGLDLRYDGTLVDVIQDLAEAQYSFFHVASLDNPDIFPQTMKNAQGINRMANLASYFSKQTGKHRREAFVVQGFVTADVINEGKPLNLKPIGEVDLNSGTYNIFNFAR